MEAVNLVRVMLFWDSEIARDAYGPYFIGTIRKSWTLPTNRIISHAELVKKILKYRDMDPNLCNVRMTMSMNNDEEMLESGTVRLLDWNDSMTDIQLGMRFVDKVQTVLFQMGCTYKRAWYARKFAIEGFLVAGIQPSIFYLNTYKLYRILTWGLYTNFCITEQAVPLIMFSNLFSGVSRHV
ncbi:hypothetical protein M9H77_09540 [Catharanthus roseus]|uniref:Uncharacterized protein n=1 Tax=Catharanthus roseus TaxID=4058 RepID=A0ACC0C0Y2_CATRO|nr:hypothetical protein M9H77_09540 [Catharanthus roseus]